MDSEAPLSLRIEKNCRHIASWKYLSEIEFSAAFDMFDIFLKLTVSDYSRAKSVFSLSLTIAKTATIY